MQLGGTVGVRSDLVSQTLQGQHFNSKQSLAQTASVSLTVDMSRVEHSLDPQAKVGVPTLAESLYLSKIARETN